MSAVAGILPVQRGGVLRRGDRDENAGRNVTRKGPSAIVVTGKIRNVSANRFN
jgi:hypothetical protein